MARWKDDTTFKFVTAYLEQECLWNVKSPLYKNKAAKAIAIDVLGKTMGIQGFRGPVIKQKIKNIRSTYSQELKKVKDSILSGLNADTVYVPNVKWFAILDERLRNMVTDTSLCESYLTQQTIDHELDDEFEKHVVFHRKSSKLFVSGGTGAHSKVSEQDLSTESNPCHGKWNGDHHGGGKGYY